MPRASLSPLLLRQGMLCGALLLSSLLCWGLDAKNQRQDMDRLLILTARQVQAGLETAGPEYLQHLPAADLQVLWYGPEGSLVARSGPSPNPTLRPTRPQQGLLRALPWWMEHLPSLQKKPVLPEGATLGTLEVQGERWRSLTWSFAGQQVLEARFPLMQMEQAQRVLLVVMLMLTLLMCVLMGVILQRTTRRVLAPLRDLTRTADRIARSGDLSQRVSSFPVQDELGDLSSTLNQMLNNLEWAVKAQRQFVAEASHELRTPITIVRGNLELLQRYPTMLPEQRDAILHDALLEMSRLGRLVEDLLTVAKKDAGLKLLLGQVHYSEVVVEAVRNAQKLKSEQHLSLLQDTDLWVKGDRDRLSQLLLILLDNALKYTPQGGHITVQVTHQAGWVTTVVQDTGVGMTAEEVRQVFERFFRAEHAREHNPTGSGLGLPIAHWIVEQHGGTVDVQSEVGQGTRVTFTLPMWTAGHANA